MYSSRLFIATLRVDDCYLVACKLHLHSHVHTRMHISPHRSRAKAAIRRKSNAQAPEYTAAPHPLSHIGNLSPPGCVSPTVLQEPWRHTLGWFTQFRSALVP